MDLDAGNNKEATTPPHHHTEFLDLTDGHGGEAELNSNDILTSTTTAVGSGAGGGLLHATSATATASQSQSNFVSVADPAAAGAQGGKGSMALASSVDSPSQTSKPIFDPNTPGRVVESGQEHTGRWTKEEHEAFLAGLRQYGKEWKKVAAKVKTRTVVQTRTHAQKYFQKLAKTTGGEDFEGEYPAVDMGNATEPTKAPSTQKRKQRLAATTTATSTPLPPAVQAAATRTTSVASAAKVLTNLPTHTAHTNASPELGSMSTTSAGVPTHGFKSLTSATHGFTAPAPSGGGVLGSAVGSSAFPMKIVAPAPDSTMRRGKFPEPSPAACGKRKLAEIAAARMLAGVAASGLKAPRTSDSDGAGTEAPPPAGPFTSPPTSAGRNLATAMDRADNIEDGTATPPPELDFNAAAASTGTAGPASALKTAPDTQPKKPQGLGLSLQIVNPESLGVSHEEIEKKRKDGNASPVTPWEGQLQALVSEEKRKDPTTLPSQALSLSIPQAPSLGAGALPPLPPISNIPPICGPGSAYGRSTLHKAVCDMDLQLLQSLVMRQSSEYTERRDQKGFCPIHSACALCMVDPINSSMATEIVRMLIAAGADSSIRDLDGNTPLHWAARAGDRGTAEFLLVKNNPKDAKNERGETPLHWALRAGRAGIPVASTLLENGARPAVWNAAYKRPIDVAADGYDDEEDSVHSIRALVENRKKLSKAQREKLRAAAEDRKLARANLFECSPQSRSLVLYHPECLEHIPKSESDWENPARVSSIMERIQGINVKPGTPCIHPSEIQISQEFDRAKLDLLRKVHSTDYLNFVNELSKDLERQHKEKTGEDEEANASGAAPVVPFTPMVQRSMIKIQESSVKLGQNSDTSFSAGSLRAARRAAGAVQHAVDCVLIGRQRNAFCVVRPPGHHAGINGLLDGGESCGFCIFNSVAAGAMHAISDERLLCERCAIVDIDVHHGNGTEEIVRKCHDPRKLFFFSIHLYDNEHKKKKESKAFQYKFYPGTGDEDDLPMNIINVPIVPLWKQTAAQQQAQSNVGNHNTRHRARNRSNASSDDGGDSSEAGTPRVSDAEADTRTSSGGSSPVPPSPGGSTSGRLAYRKAIQDRLLPALRAFNPDLILISAGFDACKGDVGNAKHEFGGKTKVGLDLEPEDYAWTTRKILEIADICCQGRVVSVLEGGYGRPATNPSGTYDATAPLDKSLFSECATRHIHGMIDPYNVEARFSGSSSRKSD